MRMVLNWTIEMVGDMPSDFGGGFENRTVGFPYNVSEDDDPDMEYDHVTGMENEILAWAFIDGILFFSICCGNIVTIYALVVSKTMSKVISNRFILSLAISDLMVGLMVLYHMMFYIQPKLGAIYGFCIVRLVLISLACTASVFNILGIAIDRYVAIVHPLQYHNIVTEGSVRLISVLGWTLAVCISTVPTYWNRWKETEHYHLKCEMGYIVHPSYVLTMYVPVFVVLYTGICAFYLKIIQEARKNAMRTNQLTWRYPWKSIQVLTMVVGSFTVCYMPFVIILIMNSVFQRKTRTMSTIYKITYSLAMANSAVNPLIYAWKNPDLKKIFCQIIRCNSINSSG